MTLHPLHRIGRALAALLCTLAVIACGGAGELGSGGTGVTAATAEGTVTGYGSIFVDGERFDDSSAPVTLDQLDGSDEDADTQLGQRVTLRFTADNVAQAVKIEPEVVGVVSARVANGFQVLGQTVRVNLDPTAGPVTQWGGGITALADVQAGQAVEVHGVVNATLAGAPIQATRVQLRAAPLPFLRISGTVSGLTRGFGGSSFNLASLTVHTARAVVLPVDRVLEDGKRVTVLAPLDGLNGGVLSAARVHVRERAGELAPGYLTGVVSNLGVNTFRIGVITVTTSSATGLAPSGSALADGQYVRVRGTFGVDGRLAATEIRVRSREPDADLRGIASGYDSAARSFNVRGIAVDASAARRNGCVVQNLNGQYVEVSGRLGATGVVAEAVQCRSVPNGAVVERIGTAGTVVEEAKTFRLATADGDVPVRWTALTFFRDGLNGTAAALNGRTLRVEGVEVGNVLVATKIRLDR